jgi:signal transduction histidine kinase
MIEARIRDLHTGIEALEETTALNPSGPLDVSLSLTPHLEAPGTLVAFSAIIRDITARKLAARALLQSEKLASVGRLASSIAHEINNPLESVTNLLYILQSRVQDDETRSLVITAQEELARVSHIATHTLRFHKQSSGRTEVGLHALMQSVLGLYRGRLQSSHITVISEVPADTRLTCFEGELRQILVNLVSNAFDAMRSGGTLRLRCRSCTIEGRSRLRISIADNGTGINPSMLEHMFEPFFSTKGAAGTGLGLWITRDLVAKNGGSISLRSSVRPGRSGTVVSMSFPA